MIYLTLDLCHLLGILSLNPISIGQNLSYKSGHVLCCRIVCERRWALLRLWKRNMHLLVWHRSTFYRMYNTDPPRHHRLLIDVRLHIDRSVCKRLCSCASRTLGQATWKWRELSFKWTLLATIFVYAMIKVLCWHAWSLCDAITTFISYAFFSSVEVCWLWCSCTSEPDWLAALLISCRLNCSAAVRWVHFFSAIEQPFTVQRGNN